MALTQVHVPDIGDFKDVAIIEVLVKVGDTIAPEQSLITVESDKASMEIPSSVGGVIKELKVALGDKINQGSLIATVETTGESASAAVAPQRALSPSSAPAAPAAAPATAPAAQAATAAPATGAAPASAVPGKLPHASPSVRAYARELGVALERVSGSGPKGRITAPDVNAFVKQALAGGGSGQAGGADGAALGLLPWPKVDFAKFGGVERKPLSRIKKISGANLHRNWVMIPHVTHCDDADITDLEALRGQLNKEHEKAGVKFTMLAFVIKACVAALKKFPEFNASLDGEALVYKQYFHIGFAADTPNGLVVPVLKDANQKGVTQIAKEMSELAAKARDGKLGPADMQGGCFSISSLGGIGGRYFTPIINAPEVAILGLCRGETRPIWSGKAFEPRLMLPMSLSYDHRVIDGASAARFCSYLASVLGDFRRVTI